jgi:hypothetical protein
VRNKSQDVVPPAKPRQQNDEERRCYNRGRRVDAAKFGGGEHDEQNKNCDKENPRIVARMNALDNFRRYRNVSALNVAQQRHYETDNPGRPPVKNVGMADDLDVEFGPRRRSGKGVPNIDVLDFSLGFSLRDYIEYTSTCCVVNAGMMRSGGSSHETDEDEQDNRSKRSRNDLSDEIAACEQSKTRQ